MNVQDVLGLADMEMIADICKEYLPEREAQRYNRERFIERMDEFVQMLRGLELKMDEEAYVFLNLPVMSEEGSRYGAECAKKIGLEECLQRIADMKVIPDIDADHATLQELQEYLAATDGMVPMCYACEFSPWEELLAAEVNPQNYILGAVDDPTYNTQNFIFSLLWQMSFCGLTAEEHQAERAKLDRAIAEMEEIEKLPEEEQEKYVHDLDEDAFQIGLDSTEETETDAEQELRIYRERAITRKERIDVLRKLAELED